MSLRKQLDRFIFAPDQPPEWSKNPNEWLSNFDILGVLEQYETAYPEFEFIGPTPIDFDTRIRGKCVEKELCAIDVPKLIRSGKTKIGVVFNLDKHNEPGSHWVSLFIDTIDRFIFYFDSANNHTPPEINALVRRVQSQLARHQREYSFYRNKITHQHNNTECGVYSLFFIVTMLTKNTEIQSNMGLRERLDLFLKHRIPDKFMETYRAKYFNGGHGYGDQVGGGDDGLDFYLDARREIQLFTKAEEDGILKETLEHFNNKPNILELLSLPGIVKRHINANRAKNVKNILTAKLFKYKIKPDGTLDESQVLDESDMRLYIFPLLIQMETMLDADYETETDEIKKEQIRDKQLFVINLVRSVSNIIGPMWYNDIYGYLKRVSIPSVLSSLTPKINGLLGSSNKDNSESEKAVSFQTSWHRALYDDRYAEDPHDTTHTYYTPTFSSTYSGESDVNRMNGILNSIYYLGDKPQMPVAQQTGKHTAKRKTIMKTVKKKGKKMFRNLIITSKFKQK